MLSQVNMHTWRGFKFLRMFSHWLNMVYCYSIEDTYHNSNILFIKDNPLEYCYLIGYEAFNVDI